MRVRISNRKISKEVKGMLPVIPEDLIKERGCSYCPYYVGNVEKQPRCMLKECAWDDEEEYFHPALRTLIPYYKGKMERAKEKYEEMKETYETLEKMFAREVRQEAMMKDECYGCVYSKSGPCIGTCYKKLEASKRKEKSRE